MAGKSAGNLAKKWKVSYESIRNWRRDHTTTHYRPAAPIVTPEIARAAKRAGRDPAKLAKDLFVERPLSPGQLKICKHLKIKPEDFVQVLCDELSDGI